jgi:hypothetical protein
MPDAIVGREPTHIQVGDTLPRQIVEQRPIFLRHTLEGRIAMARRLLAFADDDGARGELQRRMKTSALRVRHTMDWPDATVHLEMTRFGRVPVARGVHGHLAARQPADESVERRHHAVAIRDRQRPARAEVLLHVDNQQGRLVRGHTDRLAPEIWRFSDSADVRMEEASLDQQIAKSTNQQIAG